MELKLKKTGHEYYEPVVFTPFSSEITKENIVPDSCADIARIVETTGAVQMTGREIGEDGRICAAGMLKVDILYIAEKESGPRALHLQIPFQCCSEEQCGFEPCFCDIKAQVLSLETRLLNPRKVLTHGELRLFPSCCKSVAIQVAEDVDDCPHIQLLRQEKSCTVVAAVKEKEFSFTEEIPVSPGRNGVAEVISSRAELRTTDCKLIGSKLVLKGLAAVVILYRDTEGALLVMQQEIPFSQILDGSGVEEDWETYPELTLCAIQCAPGSDSAPHDPHMLQVTAHLRARVVLSREQHIQLISDLYSTKGEVRCDSTAISLREDSQHLTRRQSGRVVLETGTAVKTVVDMEAGPLDAVIRAQDDRLEGEIRARCLYCDEHDGFHAVRGSFPVSMQIQRPPASAASGKLQVLSQDLTATIVPEGLELRFPMEWEIEQHIPRSCSCINAVELDEEERPMSGAQPSLILRRAGEGESLWHLAKQYRTTCSAIMEVNDLSEGAPLPCDRLLLIPKA